MVTLANELQPLKAPYPISDMQLGIVTLANELHPPKIVQSWSQSWEWSGLTILVTELGIVTLANELQPLKA